MAQQKMDKKTTLVATLVTLPENIWFYTGDVMGDIQGNLWLAADPVLHKPLPGLPMIRRQGSRLFVKFPPGYELAIGDPEPCDAYMPLEIQEDLEGPFSQFLDALHTLDTFRCVNLAFVEALTQVRSDEDQ